MKPATALGYVATLLILLHVTTEGLAGNRSDIETQRGIVTLTLEIDSDGYPHHVAVVSGVSKRADKQVLKQVKDWHFEPAIKDGSHVAVQVLLQVKVDCSDPTTDCKLERDLPTGAKPESLPPLTNSAEVY
ncbi:MAG TPA: energy transducer TonB [Terriglobales bacterium]|nr:energy transducer TonB [Terriglobales bacterium]